MARKISVYGLLIAAIVALSLMILIPVPATNGFVTLCDGGIYAVALVFGPFGGAIVGGLSGGLIDLFSGYPQWMIFSLLIHGLQGWVVGYYKEKPTNKPWFALALGSVLMVAGYFGATSFLYGQAAGWASLIGNLIQSGFGVLVGLPISRILKRALLSSHLQQN